MAPENLLIANIIYKSIEIYELLIYKRNHLYDDLSDGNYQMIILKHIVYAFILCLCYIYCFNAPACVYIFTNKIVICNIFWPICRLCPGLWFDGNYIIQILCPKLYFLLLFRFYFTLFYFC